MSHHQSAFDAYTHFLIIDFEATCCDQRSVPRQEMEIIEIGAAMVSRHTLTLQADFQAFIKPVRHPELTPFCTELTSIQQADVDSAAEFPEVLERFLEWSQPFAPCLFCSWGDYDKSQLKQDCRYHRVPYPFPEAHLNLKKQFSISMGFTKKFGMAQALKRAGLELEGTHHRGIDDARNMARMMPWIVGGETGTASIG